MKTIRVPVFAALISVLIACGGQGLPLPPKPPQDTPNGQFNAPTTLNYTVQEGLSFALASINWSTTASAANVTVRTGAGKLIGAGPSGPATVEVPVGTTTFQIYASDVEIGQPISLTGVCVAGTTLDSAGVCVRAVSP